MTHRDTAPHGAPCWTDVQTSDVDASTRSYGELFGWEATEAMGGYFILTQDGVPAAGLTGEMSEGRGASSWTVYFNTDDIDGVVAAAPDKGGRVTVRPAGIADMGQQAFFMDPTGARHGAWQPGTFQGFTELSEDGFASWFELHTNDFNRAVEYYASLFGAFPANVGDTDEFRYTLLMGVEEGGEMAGIADSSSWLADQDPYWAVYWHTSDAYATSKRAAALGGTVVDGPVDTPYGAIATLRDTTGVEFRLRTPPVA